MHQTRGREWKVKILSKTSKRVAAEKSRCHAMRSDVAMRPCLVCSPSSPLFFVNEKVGWDLLHRHTTIKKNTNGGRFVVYLCWLLAWPIRTSIPILCILSLLMFTICYPYLLSCFIPLLFFVVFCFSITSTPKAKQHYFLGCVFRRYVVPGERIDFGAQKKRQSAGAQGGGGVFGGRKTSQQQGSMTFLCTQSTIFFLSIHTHQYTAYPSEKGYPCFFLCSVALWYHRVYIFLPISFTHFLARVRSILTGKAKGQTGDAKNFLLIPLHVWPMEGHLHTNVYVFAISEQK
jgi:hypothetical protein